MRRYLAFVRMDKGAGFRKIRLSHFAEPFPAAAGTMLDIFSALVLMVPLLPVAIGYAVDPVHLGIIFLANMQIGYFTPPVE